MNRFRNKICALLVATSYLLASTLSGLLHDHGDEVRCCHAPTASCAAHGCVASHPPHDGDSHHDHGDCSAHQTAKRDLNVAANGCHPLRTNNGNCVACQFLSEQSLAAHVVCITPSADTVSHVGCPTAWNLPAPTAHVYEARGPPAAV